MFSGRQILKHTLLLTAAALLLRFFSMLFQAHLAGRIGADGLGAVQLVLSVSAFATTLGLAGMRVAASCLCAEAHGRQMQAQVQQTAAHCLCYTLAASGLTAAGLFIAAPVLSESVLHEPAAADTLRLLAGLIPVGCVNLVLGGYLTATGKVLQLTAVDAAERVLGLCISMLLLQAVPQDVRGACFALLGGELLSSCAAGAALYRLYLRGWHGIQKQDCPNIGHQVRRLAIPLALSDLLRAALRTLEQFLIPWGLSQAGAGRRSAMTAYGTVTGMVFPVLMLPSAFLYALVDLLIPELAANRAQHNKIRLASVTGQCLRAGLLFSAFTAGLLYTLAEPLTALLYQSAEAGRLLQVFSPIALILYMDALVDGMLKGLSEQAANVRYNTLTSALDAVLLFVLLPRFAMTGYIFTFTAAHLINFMLSLRRLLRVTGCRCSPGVICAVVLCAAAGCALASCLPETVSVQAGLFLRAAVFCGSFLLIVCLSGMLERCLPQSLRPRTQHESIPRIR